MSQGNNDNETVNVNQKNNYNENNDNVVPDKYERSRKVERIADALVEKLGNGDFRGFYCKVAYRLSEARIWYNYEAAVKANPNDPGRLFTFLCKRDGV